MFFFVLMVDEILFVYCEYFSDYDDNNDFFFRLIYINVLKIYVLYVWSSVLRLNLNKKKYSNK